MRYIASWSPSRWEEEEVKSILDGIDIDCSELHKIELLEYNDHKTVNVRSYSTHILHPPVLS
jgi:hypothetical protein